MFQREMSLDVLMLDDPSQPDAGTLQPTPLHDGRRPESRPDSLATAHHLVTRRAFAAIATRMMTPLKAS